MTTPETRAVINGRHHATIVAVKRNLFSRIVCVTIEAPPGTPLHDIIRRHPGLNYTIVFNGCPHKMIGKAATATHDTITFRIN